MKLLSNGCMEQCDVMKLNRSYYASDFQMVVCVKHSTQVKFTDGANKSTLIGV